MQNYPVLTEIIERALTNNPVAKEIIHALYENSTMGVTSCQFRLDHTGEYFVLGTKFEFQAHDYRVARQDVLNILGFKGFEVIEGKDRADPNRPLVTIIVKPIRGLVSGREEVGNV